MCILRDFFFLFQGCIGWTLTIFWKKEFGDIVEDMVISWRSLSGGQEVRTMLMGVKTVLFCMQATGDGMMSNAQTGDIILSVKYSKFHVGLCFLILPHLLSLLPVSQSDCQSPNEMKEFVTRR